MQAFDDEQAFSRNKAGLITVAEQARSHKVWVAVGGLGGVGACHRLSWSTRDARVSSATRSMVGLSPPLASPLG